MKLGKAMRLTTMTLLYLIIICTFSLLFAHREEISDPKIIANHFNGFFLNIGYTGDDDKHGYITT